MACTAVPGTGHLFVSNEKIIPLLFRSGGVVWKREVHTGPVAHWGGGESVAGTVGVAAGSVSVHRDAGSGKARDGTSKGGKRGGQTQVRPRRHLGRRATGVSRGKDGTEGQDRRGVRRCVCTGSIFRGAEGAVGQATGRLMRSS